MINPESILCRRELMSIKMALALLVRSPFSSNIGYNKMRAEMYAMREKHGGRKKEGRKEGKQRHQTTRKKDR